MKIVNFIIFTRSIRYYTPYYSICICINIDIGKGNQKKATAEFPSQIYNEDYIVKGLGKIFIDTINDKKSVLKISIVQLYKI